jgi:hypothetical protein
LGVVDCGLWVVGCGYWVVCAELYDFFCSRAKEI